MNEEASIRPLHFAHDTCLRCSTRFAPGDTALVAFGGPEAVYREVGLVICQGCVVSSALDLVVAEMEWVGSKTESSSWPILVGEGDVDGYAKVSRLSNGAYRIGLHRGHVEVWSASEVMKYGRSDVSQMGYSPSYQLYGSVQLLGPDCHVQQEVRFVRLVRRGE
jgi:hypothetical protein